MNHPAATPPHDLPTAVRIGFIGAGRMAQALAAGFVARGLADADALVAFDPYPAAAAEFARLTGGKIVGSNAEVAAAADLLFLAIKPQLLADVGPSLAPALAGRHLVVSILAGIPLLKLRERLGPGPRLVRVMPNTPVLVGCGAAAFACDAGCLPDDADRIEELLSAVGTAHAVKESQLDAVTGLSGSGPAFVYVMIEALADGGVLAGLPRDLALALAAQTVKGSAEMVLKTGLHPGLLKDQVASPGGTTIAGLAAAERAGLRHALISAVDAASRRSQELGGK